MQEFRAITKAGHHVEGLVVKMFHEGDAGAVKTVSARATLGAVGAS
jgi:hypothetical protein